MQNKRITVTFNTETYEQMEKIAYNSGESLSEVTRHLVKKGLSERVVQENTDLIADVVREQMEIVVKPHIERLAKLSSKSGHMSATATFLTVQTLMDLVPDENRKNVKDLYNKARKKSVEYMRTRTEDWDNL